MFKNFGEMIPYLRFSLIFCGIPVVFLSIIIMIWTVGKVSSQIDGSHTAIAFYPFASQTQIIVATTRAANDSQQTQIAYAKTADSQTMTIAAVTATAKEGFDSRTATQSYRETSTSSAATEIAIVNNFLGNTATLEALETQQAFERFNQTLTQRAAEATSTSVSFTQLAETATAQAVMNNTAVAQAATDQAATVQAIRLTETAIYVASLPTPTPTMTPSPTPYFCESTIENAELRLYPGEYQPSTERRIVDRKMNIDGVLVEMSLYNVVGKLLGGSWLYVRSRQQSDIQGWVKEEQVNLSQCQIQLIPIQNYHPEYEVLVAEVFSSSAGWQIGTSTNATFLPSGNSLSVRAGDNGAVTIQQTPATHVLSQYFLLDLTLAINPAGNDDQIGIRLNGATNNFYYTITLGRPGCTLKVVAYTPTKSVLKSVPLACAISRDTFNLIHIDNDFSSGLSIIVNGELAVSNLQIEDLSGGRVDLYISEQSQGSQAFFEQLFVWKK